MSVTPLPPPESRFPRGPRITHWYEILDWPGIVAFVLAMGLSISLVLGFAGVARSPADVSPEGANLLSTIAGAAVGAVATYLGVGRREQARREIFGQHRSEQRAPTPPTP